MGGSQGSSGFKVLDWFCYCDSLTSETFLCPCVSSDLNKLLKLYYPVMSTDNHTPSMRLTHP